MIIPSIAKDMGAIGNFTWWCYRSIIEQKQPNTCSLESKCTKMLFHLWLVIGYYSWFPGTREQISLITKTLLHYSQPVIGWFLGTTDVFVVFQVPINLSDIHHCAQL